MATTVNGWPVISSNRTAGDLPRLRKWNIPGTGRHFVCRDGSVGFILAVIALIYHERVERLNLSGQVWDEWGWAVRPVRGKTSGYSNHAGGAAVDVNATLHPIGVPISRTFTTKQINLIRRIIRNPLFGGLVIWGGDWRRPDGMHFEVATGDLRRAEKVAKRLFLLKRGRRVLEANPGARAVIES